MEFAEEQQVIVGVIITEDKITEVMLKSHQPLPERNESSLNEAEDGQRLKMYC